MSERPTPVSGEERWAIGQLVVVAGPPAVGKSRLIRRLGRDDVLRERLGVPNGAASLDPRKAEAMRPAALESLILHYDLLRLLNRGIPAYECDSILGQLLEASERVTFLTLRTTADRLRAQLEQRRIARPGRPPHRQAYLRTLRELYREDGFVRGWYALWLEFVARYDAITTAHSFVEVDRAYSLTPADRPVEASAAGSGPAGAQAL